MSCYPEPESHYRDWSQSSIRLATKNGLDHAIGVDTSDLAARKGFIALKAEVDKLSIKKVVNVSTSLNNLKQN